MNLPKPSESLRNALATVETTLQQTGRSLKPGWPAMIQLLFSLYGMLKATNQLEIAFDMCNPYDRSMLVWCLEMDLRRSPDPAPMDVPDMLIDEPILVPSKGLRKIIAAHESALSKDATESVPAEIIMAAALMTAYHDYQKSNNLKAMFFEKNPFDQSLLAWCIEAERRQNEADVSQN